MIFLEKFLVWIKDIDIDYYYMLRYRNEYNKFFIFKLFIVGGDGYVKDYFYAR